MLSKDKTASREEKVVNLIGTFDSVQSKIKNLKSKLSVKNYHPKSR